MFWILPEVWDVAELLKLQRRSTLHHTLAMTRIYVNRGPHQATPTPVSPNAVVNLLTVLDADNR